MHSKHLLIAIAALALTATSTQAWSGSVLVRAELNDEQLAAFAVARELQKEGDYKKAKEVLVDAGIDDQVMERLRSALSSARTEARTAILLALENNDFAAFRTAVDGTALRDIVTTEGDFRQFKEAHDYKSGDIFSQVRTNLADLTLFGQERHLKAHKPTSIERGPRIHLTTAQADALQVAQSANDQETVAAIWEEAGLVKQDVVKRLKDGRFIEEGE